MEKYTHLVKLLEFDLQNGAKNVYARSFNGYTISCDFEHNKIDYGSKIKCHRKTTANFSQAENLVVLECVIRLLEKGYRPDDIELEKTWNLGHKGKGFLDILVKNKIGNSLFMIECKTWGDEFNKEKNKTFKDGGQLLSYFRQDKRAKALCLYASTIKNNKIHYTNEIIDTENLKGENEIEIFDSWGKSFLPKGIFEPHVHAYEFKTIGLTYDDLEDLEKSDGKTIFNQFAEILRRHVVSDKTNAFNKIFNLFICKIKDEDQRYNKSNEELLFQYKRGETYECLIDKLKELYKEGLQDYIRIIVPYISREELQNSKLSKEKIDEILYYRESQEFSFKDVYNKETFEENTEIVKEVVELLQKYKIKYAGKQQHLGDFFELLLNTGIKQESGQFFTPIPIARFICKSLPIEEIIEKKNNNKELYFLPYVMDYASGSGHFITEIMDEIDGYVRTIDEKDIKGGREAVKEFNRNKEYIAWAKEYIYAIEKDYRLVKISKIASFLNGDGDANVMSGDGLAPFVSDKYTGILQTKENKKENNTFDIIVANPPYSVSGFKKSSFKEYEKLKLCPDNYFELYESLTDQSSEIECLFIERSKQILKNGGVAGIILPVSILTNSGIYEKTREIIFKNFTVRAIISLGSNAFMATGTKTIIAFIQKRDCLDFRDIEKEVDRFIDGGFIDVAVGGIKNAFSTYVKNAHEALTFENYCKILKGEKLNHELAKEYKELNNKQIKDIEKQKLIYFILTYPQKIVLADSGEKDVEKEFYGFEFSSRRGHEGIHMYKDEEGYLQSKLYDENNLRDKNKLNTYVLKSFENCETLENEIHEIQSSEIHPLKDHIHYIPLSNLIAFDLKRFDKSVNLNKKTNLKIESKWEIVKLEEVVGSLESGKRDSKVGSIKLKDGVLSIGGEQIGLDGKIDFKNLRYVSEEFYQNSSQGKIKINDILICKDGALTGKTAIVGSDYAFTNSMVNEHVFIVRGLEEKIMQKFLFYFLYSITGQKIIKSSITGSGQGGLNRDGLLSRTIPLPPLEVQYQIVEETTKLEKAESETKDTINTAHDEINKIFNYGENTVRIGDVLTLEYGKALPKRDRRKGVYPVCGSNGIDGYHHEYLIQSPAVIVGRKGSAGKVNWVEQNCTPIDTTFYVKPNLELISLRYAFFVLKHLELSNLAGGIGTPGLNRNDVYSLKFNLPPLSEQQKIIAKIELLEQQIEKANTFLSTTKEQKQVILDTYLK